MRYLIKFQYEHWCRGFTWKWETLLVEAEDFESACKKIKSRYYNARYFENKNV